MPAALEQASSMRRRTSLASFENAYAVAVQAKAASGADQFIVATGNPIQPFRVSRERPTGSEVLQALVA